MEPKKRRGWIGLWHYKLIGPGGELIEEWESYNALADEGEQMILDVFLRNGSAPTQFYIRLFNDTPVDTDAISNLTGEASGNGYAAALIERSNVGWPTLALDSGDYQAESTVESFTASGGSFGPVTYAVLTTSTDSSGKLIAYNALDATRTIDNGVTLRVDMKIKLG